MAGFAPCPAHNHRKNPQTLAAQGIGGNLSHKRDAKSGKKCGKVLHLQQVSCKIDSTDETKTGREEWTIQTEWSVPAYEAAMEAASAPRYDRHRQAEWDAENMVTESTRFTVAQDAELRRCCREAGISRYQLINYMLRLWMAGWDARKGDGHGNNRTDESIHGN